jgi:hypothetical protein
VMLFQAVMKFLSRSKFSLLRKWSINLPLIRVGLV